MSNRSGSGKAAGRSPDSMARSWMWLLLVIVNAKGARRNEAQQPAAIFVGYSVISSIQGAWPVFHPLEDPVVSTIDGLLFGRWYLRGSV